MTTPEEIGSKIVELVREAPNGTLLGVRLGIQLRNNFPEFSPFKYGSRNLRHFISQYAADVKESGRSGSDITYAVNPQGAIPATVDEHRDDSPVRHELPIDLHCWKAFTNPSYPFVLAVNLQTGEYRAFRDSHLPSAPWLAVSKCASEVHLQIAKDFTAGLSEPLKSQAVRVLEDPKWFVRFYGILQRKGLGESWGAFKREHLIRRFNEAVKQTGAAPPPPPLTERPQHFRPQHSPTPRLDDEAELRKLVSRIVNVLSVTELRSLRVPLGDVFDAMTKVN